MTSTRTGLAPAKINLCLYLTGLREDGYHLLESLVVFADVGDRLDVSPANDLSLRVEGPFAPGVPTDATNIVLRAADLLRARRGIADGAAIRLGKHLPHGGGIGGGSSDAACVLRLLAELWGVPPLSPDEALPLGADVPVCLQAPQATEMRGIGEDLRPAPYPPSGWLVLVNPGVTVPTGAVFALHDRLYPFSPLGMDPLSDVSDQLGFETWLAGQRNDLTKVTCTEGVAPVVQTVLAALRADALDADMSGSGSTCWGYFRTAQSAQAASARIAALHPEWWVRCARILP